MEIAVLVILLHIAGCIALERHGTLTCGLEKTMACLEHTSRRETKWRDEAFSYRAALDVASRQIERMHRSAVREMQLPRFDVRARVSDMVSDRRKVISISVPTLAMNVDDRRVRDYGEQFFERVADEMSERLRADAYKATVSALAGEFGRSAYGRIKP